MHKLTGINGSVKPCSDISLFAFCIDHSVGIHRNDTLSLSHTPNIYQPNCCFLLKCQRAESIVDNFWMLRLNERIRDIKTQIVNLVVGSDYVRLSNDYCDDEKKRNG